MHRLVLVGLVLAVPSLAMAGARAVHTTSRIAPVARSAPVMRSAPMRSFTPTRTFQRTPSGVPSFSGSSRTVFHTGGSRIFANPVRREVTRSVRFHGGVLALPAIVTLGAPVLLHIPSIADVTLPHDTYTTLHPPL